MLLRELLRLELEYRRKAEERPVLADYLGRFGADEGLLRRVVPEPGGSDGRPPPDATRAPLTAHGGIDETDERAAPVATALPQRIGRYRVERILGQGGFGIVYLAHDDQLTRQVAIKVPHRRLVSRPEDAAAYLAEARTVANLDHPNIVPVHDVGSTDEFPCYVVSKYIDGTDLATRLKTARPSIRETVELVATVAEALRHAHKQGLVHRDIKPGNILLDKSGKPFVADFGLALRDREVGTGPRYAGTPPYMSPEQARGEGPWVDGRSDIFSLGVVFYELLVGRRPFHAESREELLEQISTHEARPPRQWDDTIPNELERICLKALAKQASDRYTTAKDVADDLRFFSGSASAEQKATVSCKPIGDGGAAAPVPSATPASDQRAENIVPKGSTVIPATQPKWTQRKLAIGLAACVALAGLGLVVAATRRHDAPDLSGDNKELAPRSLDSLKRDSPFQLLDRKPLSVGWDFDNLQWQLWSPEEKLLQVIGGPSRLFVVGTTALPSYDIEVDIKQAPWTGEMGIFWGFHEDRTLKEQRIQKQVFAGFHFLRIEHRTSPKGVPVRHVHRGKGSLSYNSHQEVAVDTTSLFSQKIPFLSGQVRVKIEVRHNRLVKVEIARESLTELCSKEANNLFQTVPYQGGIGLLTLSHTVTFSEVRFVSRSNP